MKKFLGKHRSLTAVAGFGLAVACLWGISTAEIKAAEKRPLLYSRGQVGQSLNIYAAPGSLVEFDNRIDGPLADERMFGIVCGVTDDKWVTIALIGTRNQTCEEAPAMTPSKWYSTYPIRGVHAPQQMPIGGGPDNKPELYNSSILWNVQFIAGVEEWQKAHKNS